MAKEYNYQSRTRAPVDRMEVRTEEKIIKKVEKIEEKGVQKLKITTTNGTQCTISQKDEEYEHSSEKWRVLYEYLDAGDKVKIGSYAGKIIACGIEFFEDYYIVMDFQKSDSEVILTLKNEEEIKVKITKEAVEEEKMICKDGWNERVEWDEIHNVKDTIIDCEVQIRAISERVFFLHLEGFFC